MNKTPNTAEAIAAIQNLTLEEVERRLAEIDGERASLSSLRRSLVARERVRRRSQNRSLKEEVRRNG